MGFVIVALVVFLVVIAYQWVAPTPSARVDPVGIYLEDGYRTLITFAADTNLSMWEIDVQPPGIDGGDEIDTTTMHNDTWRTRSARQLKTMTENQVRFAYDPDVYNQFNALINVETTITETFPDGSTLAYYGYLKSVEFDSNVEGEMPTGTATIVPTNWDPVNRVEAGPVLTSVAGT